MRGIAHTSGYWSESVTAGKTGQLPVTGDWNGDGTTDLGTWSRRSGAFTQSTLGTATRSTSTQYYGAQAR